MVERNEGANGAVLRAIDQEFKDAILWGINN
jgi:hypothetical protein